MQILISSRRCTLTMRLHQYQHLIDPLFSSNLALNCTEYIAKSMNFYLKQNLLEQEDVHISAHSNIISLKGRTGWHDRQKRFLDCILNGYYLIMYNKGLQHLTFQQYQFQVSGFTVGSFHLLSLQDLALMITKKTSSNELTTGFSTTCLKLLLSEFYNRVSAKVIIENSRVLKSFQYLKRRKCKCHQSICTEIHKNSNTQPSPSNAQGKDL